jgi:protein-S-isoprenylcysteine O-methyltransferase Ste14
LRLNIAEQRILALFIANGFALAIFGVGLLSPLTPSEGCPTLADWMLFVVLPLVLLGIVARAAPRLAIRLLAILQGLLIVGAAIAVIMFGESCNFGLWPTTVH